MGYNFWNDLFKYTFKQINRVVASIVMLLDFIVSLIMSFQPDYLFYHVHLFRIQLSIERLVVSLPFTVKKISSSFGRIVTLKKN